MIKTIRQTLLTIATLLALQLTGSAQNWITVPVDSSVTMDFPAQPRHSRGNGFMATMLTDTSGTFVALAAPMGTAGQTQHGLDSLYSNFVTGMRATSGSTDLVATNFTQNGLHGVDVTCTGYMGLTHFFTHTRALYVNGTMYNYSFTTQHPNKPTQPLADRFLQSFTIGTHGTGAHSTYTYIKYGAGIIGLLFIVALLAVVMLGWRRRAV
jgi:hypothetical protein